jgi:hypothetical protein
MMEAIDDALARLYPGRRWGERDESQSFRAGIPAATSALLAERLAPALGSLCVYRRGGEDECCDFVYALCLGRQPTILETCLETGLESRVENPVAGPAALAEAVAGSDGGLVEELHLRVALSSLAPFAAVQQVALSARLAGGSLVCREVPRTGVFDPILLPRLQRVVAVLTELDIRHLDFGDLTQPPPGFDAGDYGLRYGGALPTTANYLFYPQPAAAVTTTVIAYGSP